MRCAQRWLTASPMNRQIIAFCPRCGCKQLFDRVMINHFHHFVLSVLTVGLWSVSWLAAYIASRMEPWSCHQCGWRPTGKLVDESNNDGENKAELDYSEGEKGGGDAVENDGE